MTNIDHIDDYEEISKATTLDVEHIIPKEIIAKPTYLAQWEQLGNGSEVLGRDTNYSSEKLSITGENMATTGAIFTELITSLLAQNIESEHSHDQVVSSRQDKNHVFWQEIVMFGKESSPQLSKKLKDAGSEVQKTLNILHIPFVFPGHENTSRPEEDNGERNNISFTWNKPEETASIAEDSYVPCRELLVKGSTIEVREAHLKLIQGWVMATFKKYRGVAYFHQQMQIISEG